MFDVRSEIEEIQEIISYLKLDLPPYLKEDGPKELSLASWVSSILVYLSNKFKTTVEEAYRAGARDWTDRCFSGDEEAVTKSYQRFKLMGYSRNRAEILREQMIREQRQKEES